MVVGSFGPGLWRLQRRIEMNSKAGLANAPVQSNPRSARMTNGARQGRQAHALFLLCRRSQAEGGDFWWWVTCSAAG
jgi:hypothetical protein